METKDEKDLAFARQEKLLQSLTRSGVTVDIEREGFAWSFKTWRLRQGLLQKEVGRKFGVSRYTIMRVEAGKKVKVETAYKLFACLAAELKKEGGVEG